MTPCGSGMGTLAATPATSEGHRAPTQTLQCRRRGSLLRPFNPVESAAGTSSRIRVPTRGVGTGEHERDLDPDHHHGTAVWLGSRDGSPVSGDLPAWWYPYRRPTGADWAQVRLGFPPCS